MNPERKLEIEINNKEKLGKEIINLKKLEISNHAKERFFARTNYDLEHQITQIKLRLSEAKLITQHPYKKVKKCLYLQDSFDKEIIYVVKKGKKKEVLLTVRKPIKRKRQNQNFNLFYTTDESENQ